MCDLVKKKAYTYTYKNKIDHDQQAFAAICINLQQINMSFELLLRLHFQCKKK